MSLLLKPTHPLHQMLSAEGLKPYEDEQKLNPDCTIGILNLMPEKMKTDLQLCRLLAAYPASIKMVFLTTASYTSKTTPEAYLRNFYTTWDKLSSTPDALIVTGAPVEHLKFEEVLYWKELTSIIDETIILKIPVFFICWAVQAALYHLYHIPKFNYQQKLSGVYPHFICNDYLKIINCFPDKFNIPHSRYTGTDKTDIDAVSELKIAAISDEAGIYLMVNEKYNHIYATGHAEYDATTLLDEYQRDLKKGINPALPRNYFAEDNPNAIPVNNWRPLADLIIRNWLEYYVKVNF